jgi:rhodanese-related sulfurtransferase
MGDLSVFLQQNWMLLLCALIVIIFILYEEKNSTETMKLTPERAVTLINKEDAKILDLRAKDDYKEEHIAGALNIPFAEFKADHKRLNHVKTSPIILIANSRQEGAKAVAALKRSGKKNVYFLSGGLDAWREAQMPLSGRNK